ncbi:HAD-IIIC family phosphatase [bacterium]|nr:HAD-IIIC family phosphatase [bacterium]
MSTVTMSANALETLTYGELVQLARKKPGGLKPLRVAVLGDASTQWQVIALNGYATRFGFDLDLYEAGFDQIDNEILNPGSGLHRQTFDFILVIESSRRLLEKYRALELNQRGSFAESRLAMFRQRLAELQKRSTAKVIWFDCEALSDGTYGHFSHKSASSFDAQLVAYNAGLWQAAPNLEGFYLFPFSQLAARFGSREIHDPRLFYMTDASVCLEFVPEIALHLMRMISALQGSLRKCLVLDLDNTLWGGTIGDLGPAGIEVGGLGLGKAFQALQEWALELKRRGVLLAVCSKNELENCEAAFRERPEMKLGLDDFAAFQANWEPKYENLKRIRETLNIGFDSMVFVDDNPLERDSVRQFLPEVVVPELPADPEDYMGYLQSLDLFEAPQVTKEDLERTALYQTERKREVLQAACASFEEYLSSLEMVADFEPCCASTHKRIAQLFQRSNQFNLRTIRYTESDLTHLLEGGRHSVYSCQLRDRFGDHGIISAIVFRHDEDELFLENWVMSCRVFNRQVEDFLLNQFVAHARSLARASLVGEFLPTAKNKVVSDLFPRLGFSPRGEQWVLGTDPYQERPHPIQRA